MEMQTTKKAVQSFIDGSSEVSEIKRKVMKRRLDGLAEKPTDPITIQEIKQVFEGMPHLQKRFLCQD